VFSISIVLRACVGVGIVAIAACAGAGPKPDPILAPQPFYTVMGEIALTRHEPRVAALQYQAAAEGTSDPSLLKRATQVATDTLQPTIAATVSARWISVDPKSADAHHAAARAALALFRIDESAEHYRSVLQTSPDGTDAAFARLETELGSVDNAFGARQVADKLAEVFPGSAAARQMQGFAQLRADDPAAAVRSLTSAIALKPAGGTPSATGTQPDPNAQADADAAAQAAASAQADAEREFAQALARARISAGDVEAPLAESQAKLEREGTPANRLDYALLLLSAQRDDAALEQLAILARAPEAESVALRLLGIVEYQQGKFDAAGMRFTELLRTGKFLDDAFYYLGLIAEKHNDPERALRLYAQVQTGEYFVSTLLRAATILQTHGDAPAADQLLDRLVEDTPEQAPEIFAARARIYADAGDIDRGLKVLDWGVLQYPDNVDMHYALAATYEQAGRVPEALGELSALVKARPGDPAALNALGYTLADHDQHLSRARALIERAHAAAPKNAAILDSMGWVLFRQGKTEQALPYLSQAYADDRGGDIAAHLGEVQWTLGHQAEADQIWSAAAIVDPDNRLLKSTRQRMHGLK
jgi:tetratricopeptide (TPR) repeat protein